MLEIPVAAVLESPRFTGALSKTLVKRILAAGTFKTSAGVEAGQNQRLDSPIVCDGDAGQKLQQIGQVLSDSGFADSN